MSSSEDIPFKSDIVLIGAHGNDGHRAPPGWKVYRVADKCSGEKIYMWVVESPTGGMWFADADEQIALDWSWRSFGMTRAEYVHTVWTYSSIAAIVDDFGDSLITAEKGMELLKTLLGTA